MKNIVVISGDELASLLSWLSDVADSGDVYRLRVCVDGGAKFKVNESTWTPPYGKLEK